MPHQAPSQIRLLPWHCRVQRSPARHLARSPNLPLAHLPSALPRVRPFATRWRGCCTAWRIRGRATACAYQPSDKKQTGRRIFARDTVHTGWRADTDTATATTTATHTYLRTLHSLDLGLDAAGTLPLLCRLGPAGGWAGCRWGCELGWVRRVRGLSGSVGDGARREGDGRSWWVVGRGHTAAVR